MHIKGGGTYYRIHEPSHEALHYATIPPISNLHYILRTPASVGL
jgi:hypothetical protein